MHSMKILTDAFLNLDDLTLLKLCHFLSYINKRFDKLFGKYEIFEISIIDDQIIKNFDPIFLKYQFGFRNWLLSCGKHV